MGRILVVTLLVLSVLVQPVLADLVVLRDGGQIEGSIVDITPETIVLEQAVEDDAGTRTLDIPITSTAYALYMTNDDALKQAGDALIRARNLYFIGLSLQVVGVIFTAVDPSGGLIGLVAIGIGGILQLMGFWSVGSAGGHLIDASR